MPAGRSVWAGLLATSLATRLPAYLWQPASHRMDSSLQDSAGQGAGRQAPGEGQPGKPVKAGSRLALARAARMQATGDLPNPARSSMQCTE